MIHGEQDFDGRKQLVVGITKWRYRLLEAGSFSTYGESFERTPQEQQAQLPGLTHDQKIVAGPRFQVPFSERIRRDAEVMTGTVGLIETKEQVADILENNRADLVFMAREFLRDPYCVLRALRELKQTASWPLQYLRAAPPDSPARKPFDAETLQPVG